MKVKSLGVVALLTFSFSLSTASAQESINATGGDFTGSGGIVAYSIGQVFHASNTGNTGTVSQGVQHAYEVLPLSIKETALNISVTAFPNPTADKLTLQISDYHNKKLSYQLFDMQGNLFKNGKIVAQQTQVNVNDLPPAIYFVHVLQQESKIVQLFKIIKK